MKYFVLRTLGHRAGEIRHRLERCSVVKSSVVKNLVPKAHMAAHNHRGSNTLPTLGSAYMWRTDTHTSKTLRPRKQTRERTEKEAVT